MAALESFVQPALSAIISYRLPVCFRPTHPPVRVSSEFPISPVPLGYLLLTCVRMRLLQLVNGRAINLLARPFACAISPFAEGEGFEPPNRLDDCRVSGAVLSTSQPTFLFLYVAMV